MTVTELNMLIKGMFESNRLLSGVSVVGEISNFVNHRSGHLYFSVKDNEGQIRAVMFRSHAASLRFLPENGMRVVLRGSVTVYPRDGSYQLYVTSMQPDGVGALYLAYEQLKARLSAEGLFDDAHKKPIPAYPESVGVITSPTGAAVRDIINVLRRRYPVARVYVYPALVQGEGAEESLVRALDFFDKSKLVDTVIIGRGGGSIEDLWAFNSEKLARRIFEATVPIISAVGHETDFTICDFVSDLRAPTPSAAAELASPDLRDMRMRLLDVTDRCDRALMRVTERMRERLERICSREIITAPENILTVYRDRAAMLRDRSRAALSELATDERIRISGLIGRLEGLNPLAVLARGYSLVERDGVAVREAGELARGDQIDIRFNDGTVKATVI